MAHRFNNDYGRKIPKPHATERTWSRWRIYRNIDSKKDAERTRKRNEAKTKIAERITWLKNLGKKKTDSNDLEIKKKR